MAGIDELIALHSKGFALQQEFYRDPAIFARDLSRIHMRHWLCVGHVSRVPKQGDYFVFDIADESFIVVRDRGELRALANVCRHRGSNVCYEKEGNSRAFVCPYHGWTYDLDGSLRSARLTGKEFDKSQYGLARVHLRVIEGLIFICCAEDPPDLTEVEQTLGTALKHYGWAKAKVAHRATYSVDANWKLTTENYLECYHCAPAHPEFSKFHATTKPVAETQALRKEADRLALSMGVSIPNVYHWPSSDELHTQPVCCAHDATFEGFVTGSEDGQAAAPLMGDFTQYDGGFTYMEVGPASFFLAYPDHGVLYLFVPKKAERTDMEIIWLVRDTAVEGRDYDLARLIWMWDVTSLADKKIIDHNQKGVNSRFYRPGPYQPMESQTRDFTEWYLRQISGDD